jgi:hypothetical protein
MCLQHNILQPPSSSEHVIVVGSPEQTFVLSVAADGNSRSGISPGGNTLRLIVSPLGASKSPSLKKGLPSSVTSVDAASRYYMTDDAMTDDDTCRAVSRLKGGGFRINRQAAQNVHSLRDGR